MPPFTRLPKICQHDLENSADLTDVSVQFALFSVIQARLTVAGQEISFVGDGFLDFTDDSLAGFDLLTFRGVIERNGVQSQISSAVTLPLTAFRFVDAAEISPLFRSVINVLRTGTGDPYGMLVESGTPVLGVPEPRSLCTALLAFGLVPLGRLGFVGSA